jgi:hypothetical protein
MLAAFHNSYPTGSLISELIQIYHGKYIVKVSVQVRETSPLHGEAASNLVNNTTYATGMASAETIEEAEDRARERALAVLNLTNLSQHVEVVVAPIAKVLEQPQEQPQATTEVIEPTPVETPSKTKKKAETKTAIKTEIPVEQPSYSFDVNEAVNDEFPAIPAVMETAKPEPFPEPPLEELPFEPQIETAATTFFDQPMEDLGITSEFTPPEAEFLGVASTNVMPFNPPEEEFLGVASTNVMPFTPPEEEFLGAASTNVMPFTPRSYTPIEEVPPVTATAAASTSKRKKKAEPIDQSDDIAKIGVEMQRLGWTTDQGREYLINTYNKRSRHLLSTEEIEDFLRYLESQPTPMDSLPLEPTF